MSNTRGSMSNWRWYLCALLFVATTVNYMDRQVLSLTWKEFIAPEFHWTDADYGNITTAFSLIYAVASICAGKFIDWMGTKKGYLWAIGVWSLGACLHAVCGWATVAMGDSINSFMHGLYTFLNYIPFVEVEVSDYASIAQSVTSVAQLGEAAGAIVLAISTASVFLFIFCRSVLAIGEAGNFPAAIKVTAEYFPKKDRAFATSIFNAGASVGALVAPLTIPSLAAACGWEMAFIIIGGLGFIWMFFWAFMYNKPTESKHVNAAELEYINQDNVEENKPVETDVPEKTIPLLKCLTFKQTWAFLAGKFFTDGVWWFFLFWAPAYFQDQFGYKASDPVGQALIFVLYAIVTIISIGGGYLPKYFVEKKGMEPYSGRMRAMLLFAFFPVFALFAQTLGAYSAWWPAVIIGLAGAGHQAWSANLYSTIGDMFPKSTVATITGIGTLAGGAGSAIVNNVAGKLFTYSAEQGANFSFFGFEGKPAGYMIVFCYCAVAYLLAWCIMKTLVPRYKKIEV